MVENPPWLLKAVDKLIAKYNKPFKEAHVNTGIFGCPLCLACKCDDAETEEWCVGCPNVYFKENASHRFALGCSARIHMYPSLDFNDGDNYPHLVEFWTIFRDLIKHGKSSNEAMEIIFRDFSPLS